MEATEAYKEGDEMEADEMEADEMEADEAEGDEECIRGKWLMDGATSLQEAADMLRQEASRLEGLAAEGWILVDPVGDDYGFLERDPELAK